MIVLGGLGSISGSVLGAVLFIGLTEGLREFAQYRMVLFSLLLIVLMIVRPQGILGHREFVDVPDQAAPLDRRRRPARRGTARDRRCPSSSSSRVTMRFGGLVAVNELELAIEPGQLYGLIGPNGAGKTTVFNVITGVYTPTAGDDPLRGQRDRAASAAAGSRGAASRGPSRTSASSAR